MVISGGGDDIVVCGLLWQFCHGVLWPLLHCINSDNFNEGLLESFMEQYEAYAHANQMYLEVSSCLYDVYKGSFWRVL